MKVRSVAAVLAKRFDVAVAQEIAPSHHTLGDVDSPAGAAGLPGRKARLQGRAARQGRPIESARSPTAASRRRTSRTRSPLSSRPRSRRSTSRSTTSGCRIRSPRSSRDALVGAPTRGVNVRLAYNVDHADDDAGAAAAANRPGARRVAPLPDRRDPGRPRPDAPQVRRSGTAHRVWTGSTNWTADSWTREENVIVTVDSPELAARYGVDFEQLWTRRDVAAERQGRHHARARGRKAGPSLVLPRARRAARPPDREGDRHRHAAGSGSPRP